MSDGDSELGIELLLGEVGSDCCLRFREVEVEFKAELCRERISLSISDVENGTGPVDVVAVGFGGETGLLEDELLEERIPISNYL